MIPGLVDTHVHLGYPAGAPAADPSAWPILTPPEERSLHVAANALRCARAGVTTLRDLAAEPADSADRLARHRAATEAKRAP